RRFSTHFGGSPAIPRPLPPAPFAPAFACPFAAPAPSARAFSAVPPAFGRGSFARDALGFVFAVGVDGCAVVAPVCPFGCATAPGCCAPYARAAACLRARIIARLCCLAAAHWPCCAEAGCAAMPVRQQANAISIAKRRTYMPPVSSCFKSSFD